MSAIEHLTISLPSAVADRVRAGVESGDYADADEMIREALLALEQRDGGVDVAVDHWLRSIVVDALRASDEDPSRALGVDELRDRLDAARGARSA